MLSMPKTGINAHMPTMVFMLFDMDFDGDVDVLDNVTEFMLANGELTGDDDSDDDGSDDDDCWGVIAARAHRADLNADGIAVLPADWDDG